VSIWTSANFKIVINGKRNVDEIQRLIGYSCDWNSIKYLKPYDMPDYTLLPMGSEGTLMIRVDKCTKKKTVVSVYGGLRNIDNTQGIESWINRIQNVAIRGYSGDFCIVKSISGWASTCGEPVYKIKFKQRRLTYEELCKICRR
jgi:hypothetical protein